MVQCFQAVCTHKGVPFRFTLMNRLIWCVSQVSGEHDAAGGEGALHRGPVRHAAGVRDAAPTAEDVPAVSVPDQADVAPSAHAPLWQQPVGGLHSTDPRRAALTSLIA